MYILNCADGSFYVGSCRNLEQRLWLHNLGEGAEYTKRRRPVTLAYSEEFPNVGDAFAREKQVQGWSRAKRLALIGHRGEELPELSRKDFGSGELGGE
ncbi:MAG: GIY-YIG nuclease family protein [Microbacterium sp.]